MSLFKPENLCCRTLVAKLNIEKREWLPLWVHSLDTYNVTQFLLRTWLPKGTIRAMAGKNSVDKAINVFSALALLHDLGKSSISFQSKITAGVIELKNKLWEQDLHVLELNDSSLLHAEEIPHAAAGEAILLANGVSLSFASIVGAHHGKPWEKGSDLSDYLDEVSPEHAVNTGFLGYGTRLWGKNKESTKWASIQKDFLNWAFSICCCNLSKESIEITDSIAMLATAVIIMADWIASNEKYFPLIPFEKNEPDNIEMRADEALKKLKLPPPWQSGFMGDFSELSLLRFGFEPNEIQKEMMGAVRRSDEPGIFILEAPMGIGKTEAALLSAELLPDSKAGGIFFGLPTQATSNAVFERIVSWGNRQPSQNRISIRLAHGMAQMNDNYRALISAESFSDIDTDGSEDNGLVVHEWFLGNKQALLADFVVGTIDQILMAALKQKHLMLRHLGLSGKVVIIDECHAYDAYMNRYLDRVLQWLGTYGAPVILLSATLPYRRRSELVDAYCGTGKKENGESWRINQGYPLLTWTDVNGVHQKELRYNGEKRSISIVKENRSLSLHEEIELCGQLLQEHLQDGGCAAVVVNTVKRAQLFYEGIRRECPEARVLLLHSRYLAADRLKYESELISAAGKHSGKNERDKLIVIGTQVIEQSLDFDVDYMISDLCPMDLLLQRLGRLHRHKHHDEIRPIKVMAPECYVMGTGGVIESGGKAVYGEYLLTKSRAFLPEKITLPDDISILVQKVYDDSIEPELSAQELLQYQSVKNEFWNKVHKLERDADAFRIRKPGIEPDLSSLLEGSVPSDEAHAKAQVRAGEMGFSIIILVGISDKYEPVPWTSKIKSWDGSECPSPEDSRYIMSQRLNLPAKLVHEIGEESFFDATALPKAWEKSVWLTNEHLLALDRNLQAKIGNVKFTYDKQIGLVWEKEDSSVGD